MKQIFLVTFLGSFMLGAQNTTVVPKQAMLMTRVSVNPKKAATLASFQVLFSGIAFLLAVPVALAVKRHAVEHQKEALAEASAELTFATVAGAILAGSAGVTLAQAWSNFAEAAASAIWNPDPDEITVVKTPFAVLN